MNVEEPSFLHQSTTQDDEICAPRKKRALVLRRGVEIQADEYVQMLQEERQTAPCRSYWIILLYNHYYRTMMTIH